MDSLFFNNLSEALCKNCAKRKKETDNKCKYLFEWGQYCTQLKDVTRAEDKLKENVSLLIQFQNRAN